MPENLTPLERQMWTAKAQETAQATAGTDVAAYQRNVEAQAIQRQIELQKRTQINSLNAQIQALQSQVAQEKVDSLYRGIPYAGNEKLENQIRELQIEVQRLEMPGVGLAYSPGSGAGVGGGAKTPYDQSITPTTPGGAPKKTPYEQSITPSKVGGGPPTAGGTQLGGPYGQSITPTHAGGAKPKPEGEEEEDEEGKMIEDMWFRPGGEFNILGSPWVGATPGHWKGTGAPYGQTIATPYVYEKDGEAKVLYQGPMYHESAISGQAKSAKYGGSSVSRMVDALNEIWRQQQAAGG